MLGVVINEVNRSVNGPAVGCGRGMGCGGLGLVENRITTTLGGWRNLRGPDTLPQLVGYGLAGTLPTLVGALGADRTAVLTASAAGAGIAAGAAIAAFAAKPWGGGGALLAGLIGGGLAAMMGTLIANKLQSSQEGI